MQNNKLSELIKIIEEKSDISNIVSDYISLEKKGNNYVGLCPFHSDSNPSMSVSDDKHIFKCFVCGAGGGAISFIQNYEGITFIEAVKKISDKLNINWREYITHREIKKDPIEVRGWEINQEALNFFKYTLKNSVNNNVKNYIESRGLNDDIIEKFDIGFSGNGLTDFLLNKNFTEEEIIKFGLAKRREDTTLQDYFINRLIFSIKNKEGKIIGFSGRVIEDSKYSKYLNSPETYLFKKSNVLYNLNNAKTSANLKKEIILVEGFMDVIALYKSGFENVIASMGTAFTKEHYKLIGSITNNVILAFDSDVAGINAIISTGKKLFTSKFNVDVIKIPFGKDFDDLLKKGIDKVKETLDNKTKFINFYKEMIFKKLDSQGDNVDYEVISELLKLLAIKDDKLTSNSIINNISEKYKIDKEILLEEMINFTSEKHDENIQQLTPPFIDDMMPKRPPTSEIELKITLDKFVDKNNDKKNKTKMWLDIAIDEIIMTAINYDFAFEYLNLNPLLIHNDDKSKLWNEFQLSKLNNREIKDYEIASRIQAIKELHKNKILSEWEDPIDNIEIFISLVKKYQDLLNEYNIEKLRKAILEEKNEEEKKDLFRMLSNLI